VYAVNIASGREQPSPLGLDAGEGLKGEVPIEGDAEVAREGEGDRVGRGASGAPRSRRQATTALGLEEVGLATERPARPASSEFEISPADGGPDGARLQPREL
jgi:hypothetical protein